MRNYVSSGNSAALAMPYDRTSGQGVQVGTLFGVCQGDALTGVSQTVVFRGIFDLTKEPALVISQGARVFWDNTNRRVTTTATSNVCIGHCITAAAGADATVRVRLQPNHPAGT
jgi:predicted RecA/RadA family phage recombinase